MPSETPVTSSGCESWAHVLGDAGWAGLLARSIENGVGPVWVVTPPETDTLAMVHEAMQLVRIADRWSVCFNTCFTRAHTGSRCHWRFVLEGSEEARRLRARPTGIMIDSARTSHDLVDDDPFVRAARSGQTSTLVSSAPVAADDQFEIPNPRPTRRRRPVTRSQLRRRRAGARSRQARLATTRRRKPPIESERQPPVARPEPSETSGRREQIRVRTAVIIIIVAAIVACLWLWRSGRTDAAPGIVPGASSPRWTFRFVHASCCRPASAVKDSDVRMARSGRIVQDTADQPDSQTVWLVRKKMSHEPDARARENNTETQSLACASNEPCSFERPTIQQTPHRHIGHGRSS